MGSLREWVHRLWGTLRPSRRDEDLAEEMRLHMEFAAERGRRETDASQAMESLRDQRGLPWLDDLARDTRHGIRSLRRTPVFTAVALIVLALGIGANTAIFSIVSAVLLRQLGYPQPDRLVSLTSRYATLPTTTLSTPEYEEFRRMSRSFAGVGAFILGESNLTAGDRPLRVRTARVDHGLLITLGIQPAQGRFISADESAVSNGVGGAPVAMLSHELWQGRFGGQPMVARTVPIDGRPYTIVGIMPPGADVMDTRTELWLPIGLLPNSGEQRGLHALSVIGRLKDDVTLASARGELTALLGNWGERVGADGHVPSGATARPGDHTLQIDPLQDAIVGSARRSVWVLQAAVGVVLLIVCANLATLFMARAESRHREFAVRAALGAGRGRLVRQAITEGLLISMAGGALGLWLAAIGIQTLVRAYPDTLPRIGGVTIDAGVLLVAFALSVGTGVAFGLAPAAQRWVHGLSLALTAGSRTTAGISRHLARRALVTAEMALAVMLVVAAGLLVRTSYNLSRVDTGFDRSRLITFSMSLPFATSEPETRARSYQRLLGALRATPGVQAATAMSGLPFDYRNPTRGTRIENYVSASGEPFEVVFNQLVMSDYFETMGIAMIEGRSFEPQDVESEGNVVVVNEAFAKLAWKGRSPIGTRLRPNLTGALNGNPWHTIVGVARDVKQEGVDRQTRPEVFVLAEEQRSAPPTMHVVLRTSLSGDALAPTLERVVREEDPSVPIVRLREMEDVLVESTGRPRLLAQMLGGFAVLSLLLAGIGTYGVLSYMVAERRREIGIRLALGAARTRVIALIMKQGLAVALVGLAAGLVGAFGLNRLIATLLFGVEPTDPATIVAVTLTIATVAAFACWLPAWRASRLDPNVVLRAD